MLFSVLVCQWLDSVVKLQYEASRYYSLPPAVKRQLSQQATSSRQQPQPIDLAVDSPSLGTLSRSGSVSPLLSVSKVGTIIKAVSKNLTCKRAYHFFLLLMTSAHHTEGWEKPALLAKQQSIVPCFFRTALQCG